MSIQQKLRKLLWKVGHDISGFTPTNHPIARRKRIFVISPGSGGKITSSVVSFAAKIMPDDWLNCYGCRPILMETLVDQKQYNGTCYKAVNWVYVGETTGQGRGDRQKQRIGMAVKDVYLYSLSKHFRQELM